MTKMIQDVCGYDAVLRIIRVNRSGSRAPARCLVGSRHGDGVPPLLSHVKAGPLGEAILSAVFLCLSDLRSIPKDSVWKVRSSNLKPPWGS